MTNEEAIKYLIPPIATSTEPSAEYLKQKEAYELAIKKIEQPLILLSKNGEWIGDTDYERCQGMYERYKCSECGYGIDWRKHNQLMCQDEIPKEYREYYCPHCGSKLIREVKKNE